MRSHKFNAHRTTLTVCGETRTFPSKREAEGSNVSPCFSIDDKADSASINVEQCGDVGLVQPLCHCADSQNISFAQSSEPIATTAQADPFGYQSVCNCISNVFLIGCDVQVVRSHACRVVAMMADEQSDWDRTAVEGVREAMGICSFTADSQHAVTGAVSTAGPKPAGLGFRDVLPKSINGSPIAMREETGSRTELPVMRRARTNLATEGLTTLFAMASF